MLHSFLALVLHPIRYLDQTEVKSQEPRTQQVGVPQVPKERSFEFLSTSNAVLLYLDDSIISSVGPNEPSGHSCDGVEFIWST